MKKLVSVLIGLVMLGIAANSVSAAEYEVQKGDSLWKIAHENDTTVEILMELNNLKSSLIHPKQVLKLHDEDSKAEFYIVQEGDTLTKISKEYGDEVTVSKLIEWNNLSSDLIITGQSLNVNGVGVEPKKAQVEEESNDESVVVETKADTNADANEEIVVEEQVEETADVAEETTVTEVEETTTEEVQGTTFAVEATAYTAGCAGCSGITATGIDLNNDPYAKVIAVDPNVIPLGTRVYVEGYGYAVAGDTGGAIKGNKIDVHVPTKEEAYNWGRKTVNITILE